MAIRPAISRGDVMRKHKGKIVRATEVATGQRAYLNCEDTYIVQSVHGDSSNGLTLVTLFDLRKRLLNVFRRDIWSTGFNVYRNPPEPMDDDKTPTFPFDEIKQSHKCTCNIQTIMSVGCKCGGK